NNDTPTVLGWGFFLPERAGSRVFAGFLRKPADFAGQLMAPSRATFHSLLAVFLSGLAPWNWPEVRKDRNEEPYRSTGYARTNKAVGLQHWQAEGTGSGQGTGHLARSGTWGPGSRGFQAAARFDAASKATRSRSTM